MRDRKRGGKRRRVFRHLLICLFSAKSARVISQKEVSSSEEEALCHLQQTEKEVSKVAKHMGRTRVPRKKRFVASSGVFLQEIADTALVQKMSYTKKICVQLCFGMTHAPINFCRKRKLLGFFGAFLIFQFICRLSFNFQAKQHTFLTVYGIIRECAILWVRMLLCFFYGSTQVRK